MRVRCRRAVDGLCGSLQVLARAGPRCSFKSALVRGGGAECLLDCAGRGGDVIPNSDTAGTAAAVRHRPPSWPQQLLPLTQHTDTHRHYITHTPHHTDLLPAASCSLLLNMAVLCSLRLISSWLSGAVCWKISEICQTHSGLICWILSQCSVQFQSPVSPGWVVQPQAGPAATADTNIGI